MSSGGHIAQQRRDQVERRLRSLTNPDLKTICKDYGYHVSGTKAVLLSRCLEVLEDIVASGSTSQFEELYYRVQNHGVAPSIAPRPQSQSPYAHSNYHTPNHGPMQRNAGLQSITKSLGGAPIKFRYNPFYEVQGTILDLRELQEQPQTRHTDRTLLKLSDDVAFRLKTDPGMKLMLYCSSADKISPYYPCDVVFPNQIEVKVNSETVKHNFKGLKNKPGSTKPADITQLVRKVSNYQNQLELTYALTMRRFAYIVYLVRYVGPDDLTKRIRIRSVITKASVLEEMKRLNADPDIAATSTVMSLKDPVSTMRITLPIRSTVCSHNQCFDGHMFMQLQEQAPTWSCPVCSKSVVFESLAVDKYVEEILGSTTKATDKVTVEPNGDWRVAKVDEEEEQNASGKGQPRASYDNDDDDDDDELIDVTDGPPVKANTNGVALPAMHQAAPSPLSGVSINFQTPPLSSREPSVAQSGTPAALSGSRANPRKRSSNAIIDLTLSDEDEPPRPAKRTAIGTTSAPTQSSDNLSSFYQSPTSLQDRRSTSDSLGQHVNGHADNLRPSSGSGASVGTGGKWAAFGSAGFPIAYTRSSQPLQTPSPALGIGGSSNYTQQSPTNGTGWQPPIQHQHQHQHSRSTSQQSLGLQQSPMDPPHHTMSPSSSSHHQAGNAPFDLRTGDSSLRLAPMHVRPPENAWSGQWRSDPGQYSNSPG